MMETIDSYFRSKKEYGPVFIRLIVGFHLMYGVLDNVLSWERMIEFRNFLDAHSFPLPLASAIVSVYAQLICGALFFVGAYVRVAALIMIINFLAAFTVHTNDPYPVFFPAVMMFCSSLFLLFHGPGKFGVDDDR